MNAILGVDLRPLPWRSLRRLPYLLCLALFSSARARITTFQIQTSISKQEF